MNPLSAIGMVYDRDRAFCGTCFVFGDPRIVVTAAHCIDSLTNPELSVVLPQAMYGADVLKVSCHTDVDIALLLVQDTFVGRIAPFSASSSSAGFGTSFNTYGFPVNIDKGQPRPTDRLFAGYFQRFYEHRSTMWRKNYMYWAAELNIQCPLGLSGAPLFLRETPDVVIGVVTENLESCTEVTQTEPHEVETETIGSTETVFVYRRVTAYGVCCLLEPNLEWVNDESSRLLERSGI